ncbi:MAG: hypothetical protein QOF45_978 [Gaiellaceae bacterium]|jgi:hypothetical protein|nr:hypothetical protein [Gaiellaceae bacterium]
MKRRFALPFAAVLSTSLATSLALALSGAAHGAYPSSIASTGDSITRTLNDCWFPYVDANDVCASSEAAMTDVGVFRAQFGAAMASLTASLPSARVFVSSIPDVDQLFSLYRYDLGANSVWAVAGICQSMLAYPFSNSPGDVARRARVRQRNIDYNIQLAQVCALYTQCRFDGNAVFNTAFVRSDVTTRDYFHPSAAGQTKLAAVTWPATFSFVQ